MHFLRKTPIKRKLMLIIMLTSGVALLLACIAFVSYDRVTFRRTMADELSVLTDMLDDNVASGLTFDDPKSVEQALSSLKAHRHVIAAAVYDKAGHEVSKYQRADAATFPMPLPDKTGTAFTSDRLDAFREIILAGENIGTIYIASDLQELNDRFWRYIVIVCLVLVLSSLVALVLSKKLQQVISGPVSHLAAVANAVATDKNYSVRAIQQSDDELGHLINAFNSMLNEIQSRDSALREARDKLEERVQERTTELKQEIAERERSEEALRETNQRFEIVTRATTGIIWDWDLQTNALWWNENFQIVFGYSAEEVGTNAKSWTTRIHPDDSPRVLGGLHTALERGSLLWSDEYRFQRRDGSYAFVFDRGYVVRDVQGKAVRMIGAMQDISARKQSESQFRQVWNASADGMRLTNREGLVVMVNDAYCRLFEKTKAELEQQSLLVIHQTEDGERLLYRHREQMGTMTQPLQLEKEIRLWNGKTIWIELSNSLLERPGQPPLLLSIFRDISLRKTAEAELDQTHRKLLETSRQAGMAEVATGVLHNVGNVLNSVNVSATLVSDTLKNSKVSSIAKVAALLRDQRDATKFFTEDPRAKQLPDYLGQLAQHLAQERTVTLSEIDLLRKNIDHIKDIVAMQQSYAQVSGVTETVNVIDLVDDALRMNAAALLRHDVEVVREYEPVPPTPLDKHKVLQILVNLIRNAKYACEESQRKDKRMIVRVAEGNSAVRIEISDNGVGIRPENLTRIFAHGFTTRKTGHGFGLHNAALAAKEMHGELSVHSDGLGHGAAFTLKLPVNLPKETA